MQKRWRMVLPTIGITLFSAVSYHSLRLNREIQRAPSRYFWWSAIQLDSDPANKRNWGATPCQDSKENCSRWELRSIWVDPSFAERFLMLSALPAFVVGGLAVRGFGTIGINQVWSFMLLMPVLICAWYYLIGWLLDRRISKRSRRRTQTPVFFRFLLHRSRFDRTCIFRTFSVLPIAPVWIRQFKWDYFLAARAAI